MFASVATVTIATAGATTGATSGATARATALSASWPFDPVAVDSFVTAQMARHRIPGLALAITHGNQVVHVRGYGKTNDGVPVTG